MGTWINVDKPAESSVISMSGGTPIGLLAAITFTSTLSSSVTSGWGNVPKSTASTYTKVVKSTASTYTKVAKPTS